MSVSVRGERRKERERKWRISRRSERSKLDSPSIKVSACDLRVNTKNLEFRQTS